MNNDEFGCIVYVLVAIVFMIGVSIVDSVACSSKFPNMQTSWGPVQGCLVNTEKGWIPAENYRVL